MRHPHFGSLTLLAALTLLACGSAATPTPAGPVPPVATPRPGVRPAFPITAPPLATLCARPHGNRVADALCGGAKISSLTDLLSALGLGDGTLRRSALNVNSTSLVARRTTPLNPRVVTFMSDLPLGGFAEASLFRSGNVQRGLTMKPRDFLAVGFVRGEQRVELAAFDPEVAEIRFYVLEFQQACNHREGGCTIADLQSEAIESGWTSWSLADDEDLAGTAVDCLVCHQPKGPGTERLFRMQELRNPWAHWVASGPIPNSFMDHRNPPPGLVLTERTNDTMFVISPIFRAAHGRDSRYGGIPLPELLDEDETAFRLAAGALERFVEDYWTVRGGVASIYDQDFQDVAFDSFRVLRESVEGDPPTQWSEYFAQVKANQRFAVPYHGISTADPAKLARASTSFVSGEKAWDLSDIFSDEAEIAMSFRPSADETGQELLTHFCARCHNGRLDQSKSRARFDAERLQEMSSEERALAVERLLLPLDSPLKMPPGFVAELDDAAIARLRAVLEDGR